MENWEIVVFVGGFVFVIATTLKMLRFMFLFLLQLLNLQPYYRKIDRKYKPYLDKYFKFYRNLDDENKLRFEKRVQFFIDMKSFIPRGGLKTVSNEIKAIVAGSAIQITYGYPNVYFRHFYRILIYPDKYLNKHTGNYHKGEVNVKGIIVLSINNLKKGWENDEDGINLGLHEMAHALSIENLVRNKEFNFIKAETVRLLKYEAQPEMEKIKMGGNSIFRKYGSVNFREFFAVATEVFFEKPDDLKIYNPRIFELMAKLLNVNPLDFKN